MNDQTAQENDVGVPIIVTKVRPPRRRKDLVSRMRLIDYLSLNVDRKLMLVSAPPGYGKTTLLVDFLHESGIPACWYRLDESDADLTVFFEHLITSLRQRYPHACSRTLALLRSETRPDPEPIVGSLINEISEDIDEFFLLVLDDYHTMDDAVLVNAAVDFFLRYLPDNVRLVVSSRTLPKKLTLTRLAGEGAVVGVGQEHLRFRPDEIRNLVKHLHGDDLSIAEAQALADRSEGWIAALVLGSARLLDGVRTGLAEPVANRGTLYQFLAREVVDRQRPDVLAFLRETAILDALSPDLCDTVRQAEGSAAMLEWLEEQNLFLQRMDSDDTWYRYHQLFQEFLMTLVEEEAPEEVADRHRRAAAWFHEAQQTDMVIDHLIAAGDVAEAADRMEEAVDFGHRTGRWRTMVRWIQSLPRDELMHRPVLLRTAGVAHAFLGNLPESISALTEAVRIFEENGDAENLAHALVSRSYTWRYMGQVDAAISDASRGLELADSPDDLIAGKAHRAMGACYSLRGDNASAARELTQALRFFEASGEATQAALTHMDLSAMHQLSGDVERGLYHAGEARRYWADIGNLPNVALALNNMGTGYHAEGRFQEALAILEQATRTAQAGGDRRTLALALVSKADVEADLDQFDEAARHYQEGLEVARAMGEGNLVCYALALLSETRRLQGDLPRAQDLLMQAREELAHFRSAYESAIVEYVRGTMAVAKHEYATATDHLEDAARTFATMGALRELARTNLYLCAAHHRLGQLGDADRAWRAARDAISKFGYRGALGPQVARLPEVFARDRIHLADSGEIPLFPTPSITSSVAGDDRSGTPPGQADEATGPTTRESSGVEPPEDDESVIDDVEAGERPAAAKSEEAGASGDQPASEAAKAAARRNGAEGQAHTQQPTTDKRPPHNLETLPGGKSTPAPGAEPPAADRVDEGADEGAQDELAAARAARVPSSADRVDAYAEESANAPSLAIRAFGAVEISVDGEPVDPKAWETGAARDLFLFLLDRPEGVNREDVMVTFWPESNLPRATSSFHSTLHRVRRVLGKSIISHHRDRYFVDIPEDLFYDVQRFEDLVTQSATTEDNAKAARLLEKATSLARGAYLDGIMSEWARRRADELMESTVDANLALADHLRRLDRSHDAARAYKAAVDADPLREDIHRALMRAYAEAGERVKALKHYERLVGILHEELGIEPDEATQALHVAIRDQESMPA